MKAENSGRKKINNAERSRGVAPRRSSGTTIQAGAQIQTGLDGEEQPAATES